MVHTVNVVEERGLTHGVLTLSGGVTDVITSLATTGTLIGVNLVGLRGKGISKPLHGQVKAAKEVRVSHSEMT